MRKQYHLWPSEPGPGLDAWDVDRLIRLSRDLPVHDVAVEAIGEVDTAYWFDETSRPTVRAVVEHLRLTNEVDCSYPVILSVDGRVMDGMHRVARALLEGRETVPAGRAAHHQAR